MEYVQSFIIISLVFPFIFFGGAKLVNLPNFNYYEEEVRIMRIWLLSKILEEAL